VQRGAYFPFTHARIQREVCGVRACVWAVWRFASESLMLLSALKGVCEREIERERGEGGGGGA